MADLIRKAWLESALLELLRDADSSKLSFVATRYLQLRLFHNFRHEKGHPDYRPEELIHADISDKFCAIRCRFTRSAEDELLRFKGWRLTQLRGSILKQVRGHLCLELSSNNTGSSGVIMILEINSFKVIGEPGGAIFGQPLWFQDLNAAQRLLNSQKILELFTASDNDEEIRSQASQDTLESEVTPLSQILTQARSGAQTDKKHERLPENADVGDNVTLPKMPLSDTVLVSRVSGPPAAPSQLPRRKRQRLHTAWGDFLDLSYYDCQISPAQQKILDTEECWMPPGKYVIESIKHTPRRDLAVKRIKAHQTSLDSPILNTAGIVQQVKQTQSDGDIDSDAVSWEGSPEPSVQVVAFTRADLEALRNQNVDHRPPPSSSADSDGNVDLSAPAPIICSESAAGVYDRDDTPPATHRSISPIPSGVVEPFHDAVIPAQSPAPSIPSDYVLVDEHESINQTVPLDRLAVLEPTHDITIVNSEGLMTQADDAASILCSPDTDFPALNNLEKDTSISSMKYVSGGTQDCTPIVRASSPIVDAYADPNLRIRSSSATFSQPAQPSPAPGSVVPSQAITPLPQTVVQTTQVNATDLGLSQETRKRKYSESSHSEVPSTEPTQKIRKFSPAPYHFADKRVSLSLNARMSRSSVPRTSYQAGSHPYDIAKRSSRPSLSCRGQRRVSHISGTPTRSWQNLTRSFASAPSASQTFSLHSLSRKAPTDYHKEQTSVGLRAGEEVFGSSSQSSDSDDPFLSPKIKLRSANTHSRAEAIAHLNPHSPKNNLVAGLLPINFSASESTPIALGASNMVEMTRADSMDITSESHTAFAGISTPSPSSIRSRVQSTASFPRSNVNFADLASREALLGISAPITRLGLSKLHQYDEGRGVDDILRSDRARFLRMRRPPPGHKPTMDYNSTQDHHASTLHCSAQLSQNSQSSQTTRLHQATNTVNQDSIPVGGLPCSKNNLLVPSTSKVTDISQESSSVSKFHPAMASTLVTLNKTKYAQHPMTSQSDDLAMLERHNDSEISGTSIVLDRVTGYERPMAIGSEQENLDDVRPAETRSHDSGSETVGGDHSKKSVFNSVINGVFALRRRRVPVYDVLDWSRRMFGDTLS